MSQDRKDAIAALFQERYGAEPRWWVRAPGRVDLMGSHTDYNLGYVMTMTIDRDTWIAAGPRDDRQVHVCSTTLDRAASFDLDAIAKPEHANWIDYMAGVAHILQGEGYSLTGCNAVVDSTVPIGSGLSSSAALEVATATLFEAMGGFDLGPVNKAKLAQRAEVEFVGVNCGILDQYSSAMGQAGSAIMLDCCDTTSKPAPIADGISVVICDTKFKRELTGSEYDQRRASCEAGVSILQRHDSNVLALRDVSLDMLDAHTDELSDVVERRCRFIIEENARVLALAKALTEGDRAAVSEAATASWLGARDLYEIACPEMEAMHAAMSSAEGYIGARQAGAGFGGCMVAFVEQDRVVTFSEQVAETYQCATGREPHIYAVKASEGAGLIA